MKVVLFVALLAALVMLGVGLAAIEPEGQEAQGYRTPGLRTEVDPATDDPSIDHAHERAPLAPQLADMLSRSTEGLTVEFREDGSKSVDLQGRFASVSLARMDESGKLEHMCVTRSSQARDVLCDHASHRASHRASHQAPRQASDSVPVRSIAEYPEQ